MKEDDETLCLPETTVTSCEGIEWNHSSPERAESRALKEGICAYV